jgi:hypothetical protein
VLRAFTLLCALIAGSLPYAGAQAAVRVEDPDASNTPNLRSQTASAVIQNYLSAWKSLDLAFQQNRADLLDQDFVGTAKDKLSQTIQQQAALGMKVNYQDRAHDVKVVLYSPEGLSLELKDTVDYDMQIIDHDQAQTTQHLRATYIVVMTPTETRWRVRILQAEQD